MIGSLETSTVALAKRVTGKGVGRYPGGNSMTGVIKSYVSCCPSVLEPLPSIDPAQISFGL